MARIAGRQGRLYAGIGPTGTAEPIAFLNKWQLDSSVGKIDVTAFGDANTTTLAGLPDAKGTYAGFYDDSSAQLYTAAVDGVARKFYIYPSTTTSTQYFFGTAIFDFSVDGDVGAAVNISGAWAASSLVSKVG